MASPSTMPTESLVTIKVNYDGQTKRCKLPLRDMGACTLEDKLRAFLELPSSRLCKFERYSDSAGTYVVLDRSNVSVYKQLYRAAKAKSKLKIRVTDMTPSVEEDEEEEEEDEEKQIPHPVTVEDEPEQAEQSEPTNTTTSRAEEKAPEAPPKIELETKERAPQPAEPFRPGCFESTEPLDFEQCLANLSLDLNNRLNNLTSFHPAQFTSPPPAAEAPAEPLLAPSPRPWGDFRVCCNHCERTIPDAHYHCTKCDNDDFDLCLSCVESGITCYASDHWLIKRFKKDGVFVSSTTEKIAPKPKPKQLVLPPKPMQSSTQPTLNSVPRRIIPESHFSLFSTRTCNCCVQDLPDPQFLHCTTCEDYDLCTTCFGKDAHGHHPKHSFVPAVEGSTMPCYISAKLGPGRNQSHSAICDGCDLYVRGVRHKCLDCPDWDYCQNCIVNAKIVHPGHRFVPIYEPLTDIRPRQSARPVHVGICCDGPLCVNPNIPLRRSYISGIRYKCAVCHDTDFCANCEASPANTHNKTHPLIKFKTAVRHVTVSTSGERGNGVPMPTMGDRFARPATSSRATETTVSRQVSMNSVQTVVDVEPTEPEPEPKASEPSVAEEQETVEIKEIVEDEVKEEIESQPELSVESEMEKTNVADDLVAIYIRDTVTDGTVLPPNHVFEQTWVLRNTGEAAWPAGCSVKFVGGDYMGHVDSNHPAGISELVATSESTVCYETLEPGKEFPFTVLLRTPPREGKIISYWRLTTQDGIKFGHRLWCDVSVQAPKVKEEIAASPVEKETVSPAPTEESSQMIFPKLEKESPTSSIHEDVPAKSEDSAPQVQEDDVDDFDDCDEWDASDEGFLTDEEYDILDASDEEYLEAQKKTTHKK